MSLSPFILALPALGLAQNDSPPLIRHAPPADVREGEDMVLFATIPDTTYNPVSGTVFYRRPGEPFRRVAMADEGDRWRAVIPGSDVRPPFLEYYLEMETLEGQTATLPAVQPETRPFTRAVRAASERIVPLSPGPGEHTDVRRPEIIALIDPPLADVEGVFVLLDSQDATAGAQIESDLLQVQPVAPLEEGAHEVRVFYLDESGATREVRWTFHVGTAREMPRMALTLHGRAELGWGAVTSDASDTTKPYLPYPEESGPMVNVQGYGRLGRNDLFLSINRDPIYDRDTRWMFRLSGARGAVEVGSVFPFLSESAVAWQSADGFSAEISGGRWTTRWVGMLLEQADFDGVFVTYDRYLLAANAERRAGPFTTSLTAAYGFDHEGSLPEKAADSTSSPVLLAPVRNQVLVWQGEAGPRALRGRVEVGHSVYEEAARDEAWTGRAGLEGHRGDASFRLEYREVGVGYKALGSPVLRGGEKGLSLDTRLAGDGRWRSTFHFERIREEGSESKGEGDPTTQIWWRLDAGNTGGRRPVAYLILRRSDVQGLSSYVSDYVNLGSYGQAGPWPWSVSVSLTRTRQEVEERRWTFNGQLWYRPRGGAFDARLSLRADRTRADLGDADRWRLSLDPDIGLRWGDYDLRASLRWVRQEDRIDPVRSYRQQLFSLTAGRPF